MQETKRTAKEILGELEIRVILQAGYPLSKRVQFLRFIFNDLLITVKAKHPASEIGRTKRDHTRFVSLGDFFFLSFISIGRIKSQFTDYLSPSYSA